MHVKQNHLILSFRLLEASPRIPQVAIYKQSQWEYW